MKTITTTFNCLYNLYSQLYVYIWNCFIIIVFYIHNYMFVNSAILISTKYVIIINILKNI